MGKRAGLTEKAKSDPVAVCESEVAGDAGSDDATGKWKQTVCIYRFLFPNFLLLSASQNNE